MKVALVCPSNILHMPYVKNYELILKNHNIEYEIINWDRLHIENATINAKYRDAKTGHQRNFYDYYKYKGFVIEKLNSKKFNRVIIFGIQLAFFLRRYLIKYYKKKYIVDIRDHNKIIKFFNSKKLFLNSSFTVISSPGYKEWLPKINNYVINHNTIVDSLDQLEKSNINFQFNTLNVIYLGALANLQVNLDFINIMMNNKRFKLIFQGDGIINNEIKSYIKNNEVENVKVFGRYQKIEEKNLYESAHFVNMLLYNDHINNRTCLANRVYQSTLYGKPMIALEGTYLAEEIKKYNLGLVFKSMGDISSEIDASINNFNMNVYEQGRYSFFKKVIKENKNFKVCIENFLDV